jgi:hypothetical protein
VDESEDPRVAEEVGDRAQLVEHVGRVSHTDLNTITCTLIITPLWCCNSSHNFTSSSEMLLPMSRP